MTIAVVIGVIVLIGCGINLLERAKERNGKHSHHHWQPDVDRQKSATMKNLETPPDRQVVYFKLPETTCSNFLPLFLSP